VASEAIGGHESPGVGVGRVRPQTPFGTQVVRGASTRWQTGDVGPANGSPQGAVQLTIEVAGRVRSISDNGSMVDRNVMRGALEPCGTDPVTGFYRDGCCTTGPEDFGSHTICAVVTAEFLEHQRTIGNDLTTPMPQYGFPGLVPGDRWCVTAVNWLRSHRDGAAAYVVLASTHERALEIVPLEALREHAVDVPFGPGDLQA